MKPHLSYHPETVKSSQNKLCFDLDMTFKFGELQVFIIGNNILKYYGDTIKGQTDGHLLDFDTETRQAHLVATRS